MSQHSLDQEEFLPIPAASFHSLMVLAKGKNHGDRIMQEIEIDSDGRFGIGLGTLYISIKRMVKAGWIAEVEQRPDPELDDEHRRYYRLTDLGMKVTQAEAQRLDNLVGLARDNQLLCGSLFSPGVYGGIL